ncbi:MAG: 2OG-Fe(II) oxygenase [Alphaproteobacteria bacterium]|nr:2OG-Fe(II) oxygenase [Alphaproteobacteria bacterium]
MSSIINLERFVSTPIEQDPYAHLVVPNFIRPEAIADVVADFPVLHQPGSFPLDKTVYGQSFTSLIEEFRTPAVAEAFSRKFNVDITDKPLVATVRGFMQKKDGRIHTDTESKIITVLIYMNETWDHEGGRLRILRDDHNLDNYSSEVAPMAGTLLAFRRSDTSWHGHKPFVGVRRSIQLNWVTDADFVDEHYGRHSVSAAVKSFTRLFN